MDFQNGLLGLGGLDGFAPQPSQNGLLSQYMDPEAMRKAQMKRAMLQAGIGMLQGSEKGFGPGLAQGLAGGLQGYQDAQDDFMKSAQMQYGFDQQARQDARANTEYDWKLEERARQEEQRKHMEEVIGTLPPELQGFAKADPDGFMNEYIKNQAKGSGGAEFGLVPQWGYNPTTKKYGLFQPNKAGGAPSQMQFPDGFEPQPQISYQDTGTSIVPMTTRGGQQAGQSIPKDLRGAESEKAIGSLSGKATADLPRMEATVGRAIGTIDTLLQHPGRQIATGKSAWIGGGYTPSGVDFNAKLDQLKGQTFLEAYATLKGGGQITEVEGKKATDAYASLMTAQSEGQFEQSLKDLRLAFEEGFAKMKEQAGMATGQTGQTVVQGVGEEEYDANGNRIR